MGPVLCEQRPSFLRGLAQEEALGFSQDQSQAAVRVSTQSGARVKAEAVTGVRVHSGRG